MTTTTEPAVLASTTPARRKRMLTGDRPTGKLHLGHFVGSVENRIRLQDEYEAFFIIADLHMLTTKNTRADIDEVSRNARDMVLDQLSAGIDPEKGTFYLQSAIPEVSELNTLFQNLVTVPRLDGSARVRNCERRLRRVARAHRPVHLPAGHRAVPHAHARRRHRSGGRGRSHGAGLREPHGADGHASDVRLARRALRARHGRPLPQSRR